MSKSAETALAELFAAAKAAQANAYAPYSRFSCRRGAAHGKRRGLLPAAMSRTPPTRKEPAPKRAQSPRWRLAGERRIAAILVVGDGEALCTPCGGCRQRIREFADAATRVHVAGPQGVRRPFTLAELLPQSFGPEHLPV